MLELPPKQQVWEVAYDILPVLQGQGIAKAMLKAGLDVVNRHEGLRD